jgi:hypothetical protein
MTSVTDHGDAGYKRGMAHVERVSRRQGFIVYQRSFLTRVIGMAISHPLQLP